MCECHVFHTGVIGSVKVVPVCLMLFFFGISCGKLVSRQCIVEGSMSRWRLSEAGRSGPRVNGRAEIE